MCVWLVVVVVAVMVVVVVWCDGDGGGGHHSGLSNVCESATIVVMGWVSGGRKSVSLADLFYLASRSMLNINVRATVIQRCVSVFPINKCCVKLINVTDTQSLSRPHNG